MSAADEQQLILQSKEGNVQAFRLLVQRYMKQAYNIAYGVVNHHDEAEDIAQESFVRIYQSLKSFRGDAEFSTWMYRIVMNCSLNRMSQKKNKVRYEVPMVDNMQVQVGCSHTPNHQPDVQMHIERAIHRLPTLQRAVVILRHLNGLSTKQVSGILQCSEGTVKTHLHRGLKKMRTMLDFLQDDEV